MSQAAVEQIVGKMLLDHAFRKQVMADPDTALKGFDLTEAEKQGLRNVDPNDFDETVVGLDQRVSKGIQEN